MKLFSKLMLAVLCANLVLNCFAGCSSSRERVRRENEQRQQALEDQVANELEAKNQAAWVDYILVMVKYWLHFPKKKIL